MKEIIKVTTNENGDQLVNGRELYEYLDVKDNYTDWFKRMVGYGFTENVDFTSFSEKSDKPLGGRPKQDHAMTLDMAKEISMLQRTEKGKQARQYFIQLEKFWNSPEMVTKRALEFQQKKIEVLQLENEAMKPKALFADAVKGSTNCCLVKDLSILLKQNGIDIGQNRLFSYFRKNGYLGKGNGHYNKPTQRSLDQGLFEYREHFYTNGSGEVETRFTPLVTGKGQTHFVNQFLNEADIT